MQSNEIATKPRQNMEFVTYLFQKRHVNYTNNKKKSIINKISSFFEDFLEMNKLIIKKKTRSGYISDVNP